MCIVTSIVYYDIPCSFECYVIFVIASIIALNYLGFNMTLIWGGAAALLVGLGLGLQQTFNDLFSGILLLFERSVTVGDVLKLDDNTPKLLNIHHY